MTGCDEQHELGAKIWNKNRRFWEIYKELGHDILGKGRSTSKTIDLWIKTTNNATNSGIKFRAIFWANFLAKIERFGGQISGNICSDTI
jgi:hypothetical protein